MNDSAVCRRCGEEMAPGVPGDVYCPNTSCFEADLEEAKEMVERAEKLSRGHTYARLKEGFEND